MTDGHDVGGALADRKPEPKRRCRASDSELDPLRLSLVFQLVGGLAAELLVLARQTAQDVELLDRTPRALGEDRGRQDGIPDLAALDVRERGELVELSRAHGVTRAQVGLPQRAALLGAWRGEIQDDVEPARERRVEATLAVARQQRDALERLDALEQVVGLGVGESVVGLLDVRALSEDGVRLVEEEHDLRMLGAGEELRQVLLGLADVLARHACEVHAKERQAEACGEPAGREGLARLRRSDEEGAHAGRVSSRGGRTESLREPIARATALEEQLQIGAERRRDYESLVRDRGLEWVREAVEARALAHPRRSGDVVAARTVASFDGAPVVREPAEVRDAAAAVAVIAS